MSDDRYLVLRASDVGEPHVVLYDTGSAAEAFNTAQAYALQDGVAYVAKLVFAIYPTVNPKETH